MMITAGTIVKSLVVLLVLALTAGVSGAAKPPPNAPADVKWNADMERSRSRTTEQ